MINTISEPYKEFDELVQTFEEQLELFFSKEFETNTNNPKQNENLGQVFTSPILAKFMISLLEENIHPTSRILDPCIGPNTFFNALPKKVSNCFLKGIEIDKNLINDEIQKFYNDSKRTLIQGSFFELDSKEKFDLVIQNPPYVRQELLANGVNSKSNIKSTFYQVFRLCLLNQICIHTSYLKVFYT